MDLDNEFIVHKYVKPNKIHKRLYQELLAAEAIEHDTLVVAPTGLGKTIVAVLLIAYVYSPEKSILFLAPTKPLVMQHKKKLEDILNIPSEKIVLLTGQIPSSKRKEIYKQNGIIICATPQTIENDISENLINKNNFNLVIFDEAHRAVGDYSYVFISSFFTDVKRLGLTASPGSDKLKIQEVATNLSLNNIKIKTESDYDVIDYVQDMETDIIFCELDSFSKKISFLLTQLIDKKISFLRKLNFSISTNYTRKELLQIQSQIIFRLKKSKNQIMFSALSTVASILKLFHAKELIETQGVVCFKNYINKMAIQDKDNKSSKALLSILNSEEFKKISYLLSSADLSKIVYEKESKLLDIINDFVLTNPSSRILVFNNFRDNANHLVELLNKNKNIKAARFVGQATKFNDKGLSQKEQLLILNDFKQGVYNTLVCTSVGEEGLDIPSVDLVIFYDAVASEIRSIQRKGRTGRFNAGKVILLLNKNTIDEHYYYLSLRKEKKMKKLLSNPEVLKSPRRKSLQKTINDFS